MIELISIISTMIALKAIRLESIQQGLLEVEVSLGLSPSSPRSKTPSPTSQTSSSSPSFPRLPLDLQYLHSFFKSTLPLPNSSSSQSKKVISDILSINDKCIPKHPIDEEINRRKLLYLLNLLKSPLFNRCVSLNYFIRYLFFFRTTLPLLSKIAGVIHRVPLIGSLPSHMLDTLCYINSTYFHTSNSSG
jgi:hypothetical protein